MPSRDSRGRFKPGTTGNTKGRTPDPARRALRQQISDAGPEIVAALIQAAKQGDATAAKLIMDRCLPPLRPTDSPVQVPMSGSLSEQASKVLSEVATGKLTPDEAAKVMASIRTAAAVAEITDLAERVRVLEEKQ